MSGRSHMDPAMQERFARIDARPVVLEVKNLGKVFPSPRGDVIALQNINFSVRRREFITIIGPSGCGKSTLARIIAGLEPHSSGEMLLDGRPVTGPDRDRGMVFQGYTLFPWLSVVRNVMFGPSLAGHTNAAAESEARQWLEVVGLSASADAYPHQLSGGMKQRVAIARALANRPRILLMDEPFGALDAQTRVALQQHLLQIWMNVNVTVIFITHDLDEAALLADRVIVLAARPGRIQEIVEVPLPIPRGPQTLHDPLFLATRRHLEELIHGPAATAVEPLSVTRMTPVGDDVW